MFETIYYSCRCRRLALNLLLSMFSVIYQIVVIAVLADVSREVRGKFHTNFVVTS